MFGVIPIAIVVIIITTIILIMIIMTLYSPVIKRDR